MTGDSGGKGWDRNNSRSARLGIIDCVRRARLAEASFVDCSAEFTKTTPAVSIVIAPPYRQGLDRPLAMDDVAMPLLLIRPAVNP